jgi:hypothetical protein
VVALQDAQDKAVELGVAKPNAEKVDLESELKVAALPAERALPYVQTFLRQNQHAALSIAL